MSTSPDDATTVTDTSAARTARPDDGPTGGSGPRRTTGSTTPPAPSTPPARIVPATVDEQSTPATADEQSTPAPSAPPATPTTPAPSAPLVVPTAPAPSATPAPSAASDTPDTPDTSTTPPTPAAPAPSPAPSPEPATDPATERSAEPSTDTTPDPTDEPATTTLVTTEPGVAPRIPRHAAHEAPTSVGTDREHLAQGRLGIDDVTPEVAGARFASKAVVGEVVPVEATVWREGHDAVAATLVWQRGDEASHAASETTPAPGGDGPGHAARMAPVGIGTDRVAGSFVPDAEGLWSFRVDAWSDPWATWRHAVEVKAGAGQGAAELANDLETGARLLERGADGIEERARAGTARGTTGDEASGATGDRLDRSVPITTPPGTGVAAATGCREAAAGLRDTSLSLPERLAGALSEPVHRAMTDHPVRELLTRGPTRYVVVERPLALDGSWYEFFPRSTGGRDADGVPVHGTFATAARELDRVAAMGFDVAYLPPIHPVGTVNRKGPNNTLTPGPADVGSPWAIGSAAGGHDAVDPALGTIEDFDAFVARARELGLEVALDLALQCAPDHPWAATHPEWFTVRPDGTIAYAENPPKKYQDIYPVNFDTDPDGIYAEVLRVVLYWMDHGVRVFRVDNPHTKPPDFWAWLIAEVHRRDPGVVFLAEAFTRPARLFGLAALGFSQSYTYFTWRTTKQELTEFFETHRDRIDECRPNCFVNTPDILHESLQVGGPGMFALRAALAALLSPSWGVYAGFELFEHVPVREGSEEYLDSEKYQLRPRDFAGALAAGRSLEPWLTTLNRIRRDHPALRRIRTLRFHDVDNDGLIAFSKTDPLSGDTVICVITLNPSGAEDGTVRLDMPALGMDWHERFGAVDEVTGQTFDWGQSNYVRLEAWRDVAHVLRVVRR